MGFWDSRLADLEARGEVFTENEVRVLEEGGVILHMHPLEHADLEVRDHEVGQDGQIVLIPEIVHVDGPRAIVTLHPWQYGNKETIQMSMAELMRLEDERWGYQRSDRWTDYPCYAGVVGPGEMGEEIFGMLDRSEEARPYVYWNSRPIDDIPNADQIVLQLKACTGIMVEESLWYELRSVCDLAYNYYDPHDAWLYAYHPDRMTPDDKSVFLEQVVDCTGWSNPDETEQHIGIVGGEFERLYRARVLDSSIEELAHNENIGRLPWKPLTHYLEQRGYYEAADLWRQMLARRRLAIDRIPPVLDRWGINQNEVYE